MRADELALVVGVIDRPHLPLAVRQRPLVVLLHEDLVLLPQLASEEQVETARMGPRLLDHLVRKVKVQL